MEETREAVCKDLRSCDRSSLSPNYLYMIETRQHIHQSHRRSSAPQSGTQVSTTGWFIDTHQKTRLCGWKRPAAREGEAEDTAGEFVQEGGSRIVEEERGQ